MNKVVIDGIEKDGVTVTILTTPPVPPVNPPIPPVTPPVVKPPPISGIPGNKSNPYPFNRNAGPGFLYPSNGGGQSGCEVRVGAKIYFVYDPAPTVTWAQLVIKGYNNTGLKYYKQVQTKAGVDIGTETTIRNFTGDGYDTIRGNFDTQRVLYAVEGGGVVDVYIQYAQ